MTTAVIYVPELHVARFAPLCFAHCEARGYDVVGIVSRNWDDAADMITSEAAGVLVAARFDHLNPHREPRTEIAVLADDGDTAGLNAAAGKMRRPRRI